MHILLNDFIYYGLMFLPVTTHSKFVKQGCRYTVYYVFYTVIELRPTHWCNKNDTRIVHHDSPHSQILTHISCSRSHIYDGNSYSISTHLCSIRIYYSVVQLDNYSVCGRIDVQITIAAPS